MGALFSRLNGKLFGSRELRILVLGLDNSGKTSRWSTDTAILYKLKLKQTVKTMPTVGFNVETLTYKNTKFNIWVGALPLTQDVGGQDKIRPLWRHYYSGTQGLVFVIDSRDRIRLDEARQELHRILSDREMRHCVLLVFANKQDVAGAISPSELTDKLALHTLEDRAWFVQPCCATSGEGLFEGLSWLSQNIHDRV